MILKNIYNDMIDCLQSRFSNFWSNLDIALEVSFAQVAGVILSLKLDLFYTYALWWNGH